MRKGRTLEKQRLRFQEYWICLLMNWTIFLNASSERVKTLHAFAEFQTEPSIGVKFSEDLIGMGYFSLKDLKEKNGAKLLEEFERKKDIGQTHV